VVNLERCGFSKALRMRRKRCGPDGRSQVHVRCITPPKIRTGSPYVLFELDREQAVHKQNLTHALLPSIQPRKTCYTGRYMRGGRATLRSTYNRLQRIFELRENNVRPRKQSVHGDETKAIQSNSTKCKKQRPRENSDLVKLSRSPRIQLSSSKQQKLFLHPSRSLGRRRASGTTKQAPM
jgi:hypothetical protein